MASWTVEKVTKQGTRQTRILEVHPSARRLSTCSTGGLGRKAIPLESVRVLECNRREPRNVLVVFADEQRPYDLLFTSGEQRDEFVSYLQSLQPTVSVTQIERHIAAWVPDQDARACMRCGANFTVRRRRHHCRACGQVVCAACSPHVVTLGNLDRAEPVRVCQLCFEQIRDHRLAGYAVVDASRSAAASTSASTSASTPAALSMGDASKAPGKRSSGGLGTAPNSEDYGFVTQDEQLSKFKAKWKEQRQRQRAKWNAFLARNPDLQQEADSPELKRLLRGGIPPELRGKLWPILSGAFAMQALRERDYYEKLLRRAEEPEWRNRESIVQIEKDLMRTMPGNVNFASMESEGVAMLRRVLTAYSVHNPVVGYCQSLNFLVGMFLLFMEEANAFWMLATVVDNISSVKPPPAVNRRVSVTETESYWYQPDLAGVRIDQSVFATLLAEKLPKVAERISKLGVPLEPLVVNWFLCLFVNTLPLETTLRVWDCLFHDGVKVVFRAALALLKINETRILGAASSEDMVTVLTSLSRAAIDCDRFIDVCYDKFWIGSFPMSRVDELRRWYKARVDDEQDAQPTASDLRAFLNENPRGREAFERHLREEYSEENLLFWAAVKSFRELFDERSANFSRDRLPMAREITDTYVAASAPRQININGRTQKAVLAKVADAVIEATLFDEAVEEVIKLMASDSFARFTRTKAYKNVRRSVGKAPRGSVRLVKPPLRDDAAAAGRERAGTPSPEKDGRQGRLEAPSTGGSAPQQQQQQPSSPRTRNIEGELRSLLAASEALASERGKGAAPVPASAPAPAASASAAPSSAASAASAPSARERAKKMDELRQQMQGLLVESSQLLLHRAQDAGAAASPQQAAAMTEAAAAAKRAAEPGYAPLVVVDEKEPVTRFDSDEDSEDEDAADGRGRGVGLAARAAASEMRRISQATQPQQSEEEPPSPLSDDASPRSRRPSGSSADESAPISPATRSRTRSTALDVGAAGGGVLAGPVRLARKAAAGGGGGGGGGGGAAATGAASAAASSTSAASVAAAAAARRASMASGAGMGGGGGAGGGGSGSGGAGGGAHGEEEEDEPMQPMRAATTQSSKFWPTQQSASFEDLAAAAGSDDLDSLDPRMRQRLGNLAQHIKQLEPVAELQKCEHCKGRVSSQEPCVFAFGKLFHAGHFMCAVCDRVLTGGQYFARNSRAYCEEDYLRTFGRRCAKCHEFVLSGIGGVDAKNPAIYHPHCACCGVCGKAAAADSAGGAGGAAQLNFYITKEGGFLCEEHYRASLRSVCCKCNAPIDLSADQGMRVGDREFHRRCLRCDICDVELADLFAAGSAILSSRLDPSLLYCAVHREERAAACVVCGDPTSFRSAAASSCELRGGGRAHGACCKCQVCGKQLGADALLRNAAVFCAEHFGPDGRCARCGAPVAGRRMLLGGKEYHVECVVCAHPGCGLQLGVQERKAFLTKEGLPLCADHAPGVAPAAAGAAAGHSMLSKGGSTIIVTPPPPPPSSPASRGGEAGEQSPQVPQRSLSEPPPPPPLPPSSSSPQGRSAFRAPAIKQSSMSSVAAAAAATAAAAAAAAAAAGPAGAAPSSPTSPTKQPPPPASSSSSSSSSSSPSSSTAAASAAAVAPASPTVRASEQCGGCGEPLSSGQVLILASRKFHPHCVKCGDCGTAFPEGQGIYAHEARILCKGCYLRRVSPTCSGCGQLIVDGQYLSVPGEGDTRLAFHRECFKCSRCGAAFAEGRFFTKDKQVLCGSCVQ